MSILSILSLLAVLLSFPATAQAMPTLWEIQLHETYRFSTHFENSPSGLLATTSQGPMSQTSSSRFSLDSDFGNATSLSNITTFSFHLLCGVGNCFTNLTAAGLFLDDSPNIVGLVWGNPCCILEEMSFDGWFTRAGYNWDDPALPGIPADLKNMGSGEFVHRSADIGFRGMEFGTYSIRQVPEPSTLILMGIGLLALAVRFRKKFSGK
jgi:hypothetical protein